MKKNKNFMKISMLVVMMGLKSSTLTLSLCICSLMLMVKTLLGPFIKLRDILKRNQLEYFFKNSYFGHFLDLPIDPLPRFLMTIVYEILKRRFIFYNPDKKDEIVINYCGIKVFFGIREFAIVTELKCHPPVEPIPEYIVKTEPRRR